MEKDRLCVIFSPSEKMTQCWPDIVSFFITNNIKMTLRRPTLCLFFRHKVRTKMKQRRADIKSFLKTDLKSEQKWRYVDRHYFFNNRHKVRKQTQRQLICQTNINSEKRKQRPATVVLFFNTDIKSVKNDTTSGRHKVIFNTDIKSEQKWNNVAPI
jgi:hypothetical protein